MITNADLIRELRKPGKVTVPVVQRDGVERLIAEKSDLIDFLSNCPADEPAMWCVVSTNDGIRNLDMQD